MFNELIINIISKKTCDEKILKEIVDSYKKISSNYINSIEYSSMTKQIIEYHLIQVTNKYDEFYIL
jgi:hypothetical protein